MEKGKQMSYDNPLYYCSVCGKDFAALAYFDRHRVGKHEYDFSIEHPDGRRCLDTDEIIGLGWDLDARGRWRDPVRAAALAAAFKVTPQTASEGSPLPPGTL